MLNVFPTGQSCYISSVVQGLTAVEADLHLDLQAVRDPAHTALDAAVTQLCGARRNPAQGPLSPLPLLAALNPCLLQANQQQYDIHQGWCAGEFLFATLAELEFQDGFVVRTHEEGVCQGCGTNWHEVKQ
jgi:hypothetical protein